MILLNLGYCAETLEKLKPLLKNGNLDSISTIRSLSVAGLAAASLGEFKLMTEYWAQEKQILDLFQNKLLEQTWNRRQTESFIIKGQLQKAVVMINNGLLESKEYASLQAFYLNLKIEVSLLKNELDNAEKDLQNLDLLMKSRALPSASINISEHYCEFYLRKSNLEKATEYANSILESAKLEQKISSKIHAQIVLARIDILNSELTSAYEKALIAIDLAKKHGYKPRLVEALFHASKIAHLLRKPLETWRHLTSAKMLAKELNLEIQVNCFDYIICSLRNNSKKSSLRPFLILFAKGVGHLEAFYFLNYFGFIDSTQRYIKYKDTQEIEIPEIKIWKNVFKLNGLFWLPEEGLLWNQADSKIKLGDVEKSKSLIDCISLFFKHNMKISIALVHQLDSNIPYHPLKHESKSRSLVKRLRKLFKNLGVEISKASDSEFYSASHETEYYVIFNSVLTQNISKINLAN